VSLVSAVVRRMAKGVRRSMPLSLYPYLIRRDVIGFFYHSVSDERLPHVQHLYPPESDKRFKAALKYIKRNFRPISETKLYSHRIEGKPLPPRALHLSFDDGFADCFTVAKPLLQKYGIPCTFFVTSSWVDNRSMFYRNKVSLCLEAAQQLPHDAIKMVLTSVNNAVETRLVEIQDLENWIKGLEAKDEPVIDMVAKMLGIDVKDYLNRVKPYMTREQILELHNSGFTIGAHTQSHTKLSLLNPDQVEEEIVGSARFVQEITGAEKIPFSFPYSATGTDRRLLADIRQRHPFLGLFYDTMDLRQDEPFIVNRIWAEKSAYRNAGKETNLPALLHAAYRAEAYAAMRGWRGGSEEESLHEEPG
jgi:peptidoglycan/xylan/chitin deacetylase (PgdA/CDA1 family)